jgi:hypothetical protein
MRGAHDNTAADAFQCFFEGERARKINGAKEFSGSV